METKQCTKCGGVKPLDQFGREKHGKGGLRSACRACDTKAQIAYRARTQEKVRAYSAKYAKMNAEKLAAKKRMEAEALAPYYVAECLRIRVDQLTTDLLEAKREQLLTARVTRQLTQTLKEMQNVQ